MFDKEIKIPKFLHELHGERSKLSTTLLIYLSALFVGAALVLSLGYLNLPLWKNLLLFFLFFDIAGGVVANLSSSTNLYYQKKKGLRVAFIIFHVVQPVLLAVVFPEIIAYALFVYLYTLVASLIVNAIKNKESQQNLAAFFLVIGILGSAFCILPAVILYIFAPLYMTKIILGFSVKRPAF